MLLLLLACDASPPAPPGSCDAAPMGTLPAGAFAAAIPRDAIQSEGAASYSCLGSSGHRYALSRVIEVQGVPCEGEIFTGDASPLVATCTLAHDVCLDGLKLQAGDEVRWLPTEGHLKSAMLRAPANIRGVSCGAGPIRFPMGDDEGYCQLQGDARVDGVPCDGEQGKPAGRWRGWGNQGRPLLPWWRSTSGAACRSCCC